MSCNACFQITKTKHSWSCHLSTKVRYTFWHFLFNYLPIFGYNWNASGSKHFFNFTRPLCAVQPTAGARSRMQTHHLPWQSWGALWTLQGRNKYSVMREHNVMYTHTGFLMNEKTGRQFFPKEKLWFMGTLTTAPGGPGGPGWALPGSPLSPFAPLFPMEEKEDGIRRILKRNTCTNVKSLYANVMMFLCQF